MYCLNFRNALPAEEEKSERNRSRQYTNMDRIDFGARSPAYIAQYELAHITQQPIKTYKAASVLDSPMVKNGRISSYQHDRRRGNPRSKKQSRVSIDDDDREGRFQRELQRAHRKLKNNKEHSDRHVRRNDLPVDVSEEMDRSLPSEQESMGFELNIPESSHKNESRSQLQKHNHQLKKELRRTGRILECERAQKTAFRDRLEDLETQLTRLTEEDSSNMYGGRQILEIDQLQTRVKEYKQQLEEERAKTHVLQSEVEAAKKENQKYKEKMRLLMFQHIPGASTQFQDIGSVDPQIVESSQKVADYELGNKIGEGHYGKVAVGIDLATNKNYAIKVLNKERITRFKDLQQVAMEVHVLKKYPHPNIVHLQEVVHAPDNIYLVTELCLMDLHKYHNDIGLSEQGTKQVIFGVLKPLLYLHSHGICHLDLKPENILLASTVDLKNVNHYDVRLCDFGLVNMAKRPAESKEVVRKGYACGTPGFFAPEMILSNEFEGRQADLWSLGCIILELTLGFTQEWIESYDQIDKDSDAFRDGLEKCLEEIAPVHYPHHQNLMDIIHRCLSIDPAKRARANKILAHPWLADIVLSDEGRQDSGHSPRGTMTSPPNSPSQFYAERSALVASAILC